MNRNDLSAVPVLDALVAAPLEPENAQKRSENRGIWNRKRLMSFPVGRRSARVPVSTTPPEFDRDETLVCMALALCLAGASTSIIYRLLG